MLKFKIDFKSFLEGKGIFSKPENFMVALINGYQGSGKTYFAVYNILTNFRKFKVYTNIQSFKSSCNEVCYFTKIDELYNNHDTNCVFVIDECSKKWAKDSKIDRDFYSWLQQSRKHSRYVFLIFQEYLQVPNWLRGIANLSYVTKRILFTPILITTLGRPVLDNDTCEWGLEELSILVYKRNKKIASHYDTYELINTL